MGSLSEIMRLVATGIDLTFREQENNDKGLVPGERRSENPIAATGWNFEGGERRNDCNLLQPKTLLVFYNVFENFRGGHLPGFPS